MGVGVSILLFLGRVVAGARFRALASPSTSDYGVYMAFESAFPLADLWVAVTALVGAAGLWRMREVGGWRRCYRRVGQSFYALIDLLYDLQHGMILPPLRRRSFWIY